MNKNTILEIRLYHFYKQVYPNLYKPEPKGFTTKSLRTQRKRLSWLCGKK